MSPGRDGRGVFDHRHYVPILRWKRAERCALKNLRLEDRARMTPLVEVTPGAVAANGTSGGTSDGSGLRKAADEILKSWGDGKLFLDLGLIDPGVRLSGGVHPVIAVFEAGRSFFPSFVPVITLDSDRAYQEAVGAVVAQDRLGVCLRLRDSELWRPGLPDEILRLLSRLALEYESVDLLIDFGVADRPPNLAEACDLVPVLSRWRTFTAVGGAFPKNLSDLEPRDQHVLVRRDWLAWRDQVAVRSLPRLPSFGDYAIQHPVYDPPVYDGGPPNVSASIRYAAEDHWVIMRGEGIRNDDGPGAEQWPAQAMLLRERPEFSGKDFSDGDRYIEDMADNMANGGLPNNGNPTTWLQAGLNRHLTLTARQLASLPDS